jgi:hypothetical protein
MVKLISTIDQLPGKTIAWRVAASLSPLPAQQYNCMQDFIV